MMFLRLLLFFTLLPLVEILILLKVGAVIGFLNTVVLVILTATLGAFLARKEGIATWTRIRQQMAMGVLPTEDLLDGLMILIAGVVLITPGLLTDLFGFSLLIPATRAFLKSNVRNFLQRRLQSGNITVGRWRDVSEKE
jgi:UPF0716 protein FxsA